MGGIGKTYLALKLASELYDRFPWGIIRIDSGSASDRRDQRPGATGQARRLCFWRPCPSWPVPARAGRSLARRNNAGPLPRDLR